MVAAYLVFLSLLVLERVVELLISRRNAAWSFGEGGVEYGARHFPYMKALHTVFFMACALEVVLLERPFFPSLALVMLGLVALAQLLRYWVIATLGKRWNVRVIVVPGMPAVQSGPFRFLRHPNYLAVVVEGFAVPLLHSAWWTAIGFSLLNAWMLSVRIRCEEGALAAHCR
jgi:methyltransferase